MQHGFWLWLWLWGYEFLDNSYDDTEFLEKKLLVYGLDLQRKRFFPKSLDKVNSLVDLSIITDQIEQTLASLFTLDQRLTNFDWFQAFDQIKKKSKVRIWKPWFPLNFLNSTQLLTVAGRNVENFDEFFA